MSDALDPGLKRMFAEAADSPADEAFVAGVKRGMAPRPWLAWLGPIQAAAGVVVAATILALLAPWLGLALALASDAGAQAAVALGPAALTVAALALAAAVLVTALRGRIV